jgi:hypothetical protein
MCSGGVHAARQGATNAKRRSERERSAGMSQSSIQEQMQRVQEVQVKYEPLLLSLPHVVGVGIGYARRDGAMTGEVALVVMVDQKIAAASLPPEAVIPPQIDGVRVDVQEMGAFSV